MKTSTVLVILISTILLACSSKKKPAPQSAPQSSLTTGRDYYVFGIHAPSQPLVDSIKKRYGVQIVSSSCILDSQKLESNREVDSLMLIEYHYTLTNVLR